MSIRTPTVTVAGGFWAAAGGMPTSYHRTNEERLLGMIFARKTTRGLGKVMRALNGVVPGATVTDTQTRIVAQTPFSVATSGGLRPVETNSTQYGRATTAGDVTYINANIFDPVPANQTYVNDLSGNGGGGKVQR